MLNPDVAGSSQNAKEPAHLPPPPTFPPPPPPSDSSHIPPPPPAYPPPKPPEEEASAEYLKVKRNLRRVENEVVKKEVCYTFSCCLRILLLGSPCLKLQRRICKPVKTIKGNMFSKH